MKMNMIARYRVILIVFVSVLFFHMECCNFVYAVKMPELDAAIRSWTTSKAYSAAVQMYDGLVKFECFESGDRRGLHIMGRTLNTYVDKHDSNSTIRIVNKNTGVEICAIADVIPVVQIRYETTDLEVSCVLLRGARRNRILMTNTSNLIERISSWQPEIITNAEETVYNFADSESGKHASVGYSDTAVALRLWFGDIPDRQAVLLNLNVQSYVKGNVSWPDAACDPSSRHLLISDDSTDGFIGIVNNLLLCDYLNSSCDLDELGAFIEANGRISP